MDRMINVGHDSASLDPTPVPPFFLGLWLLLLALVVLFCSPGLASADEKRPANVDKASHQWLKKNTPKGLKRLIQTPHGVVDRSHIYVVDQLGTWGSGRSRGSHQGTDFVLDMPHKSGKKKLIVGSLTSGTVVQVNPRWGAYGNTVFIVRDRGPKFVYIYAHLDDIRVKAGQSVTLGQPLGAFGCSGNCSGLRGNHIRHQVHVEVYVMPSDFKASQIRWGKLPLGQVRRAALRSGKKHAVDISAYDGSFKLQHIGRSALKERYRKNKASDALGKILKRESKRASR